MALASTETMSAAETNRGSEGVVKVRQLLNSSPVITIRDDDDLALAAQTMLWAGVRHLPVVRDGDIVGILSERDIFRRNGEVGARVAAREPVRLAMRTPAVTAVADEPLVAAIATMFNRRLGCLPVLDERRRLKGIITTADVLRHELDTALERPAAGLPRPIRAVMTATPAIVTADTELFDAVALMSGRHVRHLPVVDRQHHVVGMLSDRDVRNVIGDPHNLLDDADAREKLRATSVGDVMSKEVVTVSADAPVTSAIAHLVHERMGALPVVDEAGRLVGVVSYIDVIAALP
jgi:CBS domain-containing protein